MIHLFPVNGNLRLGERFRWPLPAFWGFRADWLKPTIWIIKGKAAYPTPGLSSEIPAQAGLADSAGERNQGVGVEETWEFGQGWRAYSCEFSGQPGPCRNSVPSIR